MLHSLSPGELCSLAGSVQRASRRVCDERIFEMSRLSRVRFHHVTIDPTDSDHNDPICPNLFPRKQTFAMQNEMSTSGQKQTYAAQSAMSALPPKADMCSAIAHVRFVPIADMSLCHSMITSARCKNVSVTDNPSALAVLRLMTSSNFVGCSTGISAGNPPCNILVTNRALCRNEFELSAP